jgi:hypothetical protein
MNQKLSPTFEPSALREGAAGDLAPLMPTLPKAVAATAVQSRIVPYFYGMDYGVGVDSPSLRARNVAVTGTQSQIPMSSGDTLSYIMQQIESQTELQTTLGISAEANGGIGLFSGSARMEYAENSKIQRQSVFVVVRIRVLQAFTQIKQPSIEKSAADLLAQGNPEDMQRFQERYGDMFVRGLVTGGQFFGLIEIETKDDNDKKTVKAGVKAAYGPFGGSGNFSEEFTRTVKNRSVLVTCYIEGGQDSPLPVSVDQLMEAARTWPGTVRGNSVPYDALLDPYSILPLPKLPNFVTLQHQKDVLTQCAQFRNEDLMALANIDYIKAKPNEFVGVGNYQLDQLQRELNEDLNSIAKAASDALDNPKDATFPTNLKQPPPVKLPPRLDAVPAAPAADGTLIKETSHPEVYIVYGGAKFYIPSWDQFTAMGLDPNAIQVIPDGSLNQFGVMPRDGTLLKELSRNEVYVIRGGKKVWVPNEDEFNRAGLDWNAIRIVPDDSTSSMPTADW